MSLERKAVPAPVADWRDPTGGVQSNLANYRNLAIFVNLETNIAAVESNGKVIYRMLTSPGVDGETPTGYWRTDAKGVRFYNSKKDLDSLLAAHHYADRPINVEELLAV